MSAASELSTTILDRITKRFDLDEVTNMPAGNPPASAEMRVLTGGPLSKLVYVYMAFPPAGLDSHMIFAFTKPDSPVPHFTLDSVAAGDIFAFHLDLIPRTDLGANLDYVDGVYGPITKSFEAGKALEGLSEAKLSPRQIAVMSPWMLASRATPEAFSAMGAHVDAYLDHWFDLVENGVPATAAAGLDPAALSARDVAHRAILFNPDVDPVWAQVDQLLGAEVSMRIQDELRAQEVLGD